MKAPEQITKVGLQIQKLNCVGLQIRRNWKKIILLIMISIMICSCKTIYTDPHRCPPTSFLIIDSLPDDYIGHLGKRVKYRKYYKNGRLFVEGYYLNGKRHGTWKMWDYEGQLTKVKKYKKGCEVGNLLILRNWSW